MGKTLACTRGRGRGGGAMVGWVGLTRQECVCDGVRSGILTSADATAQVWLFFFLILCFSFLLFFFLKKALISLISGLWRIIKNNTSCCECTSNNQTLIVLLCRNVQSKYLYIYSVKTNDRRGKKKDFQPTTPETRKRGGGGIKKSHSKLLWS